MLVSYHWPFHQRRLNHLFGSKSYSAACCWCNGMPPNGHQGWTLPLQPEKQPVKDLKCMLERFYRLEMKQVPEGEDMQCAGCTA